MKKTKATPESDKKPSKAKAEAPVAVTEKPKAPAKKPAPAPVVAEPVPEASIETSTLPMPERIGLTAGNIWRHLSANGPCSVAKLVRELAEEEKVIQRSIGWLAQEDKITLTVQDRVETIALK